MKRTFVLTLGLLVAPALAAAQVEIGFDGGLTVNSYKDVDDKEVEFDLPIGDVRVGFAAGENLIVESILDFEWYKEGDFSSTYISIVPGLNYLLNDQFYVRGEAGLWRYSSDNVDGETQYLFGGGAGIRKPLGEGALLRFEGGIERFLENSDAGIPASWTFRALIGVSAVVG